MKNMRKLFAMVLAVIMVMSLATTAFAATTGTVRNDTDRTYNAYQIFSGTQSGNAVLGDIAWGTGIDAANFLTALKTLQVSGDTPFASCTDAASVAEALKGVADKSDTAKAFANLAAKHLTASATPVPATDTVTLPSGYYLLVDSSSGNAAQNPALLQVTNDTDIHITDKSGAPKVDKTIVGENEVAEGSIGDTFTFQLTATMPATFEGYDSYKVVFKDTMSKGLTYMGDLKVMIGENEVTSAFTSSIVGESGSDTTITISCNDVLATAVGATAGCDIVVTYKASLNSYAVIGAAGNPNTVKLEYSNDPNWNGTPGDDDEPTKETPEDTVVVFTFELDVTKTDGSTDAKLEGAEFKLENAEGKWATVDANGKLTGWAGTKDGGSVLTSDTNGLFEVIGLDQGTYKLYETKAPAGYNLLKDPITVVITATVTDTEEVQKLDSLTITANGEDGVANASDGTVGITVENNAGSTLPETGGMGTTMFYLFGGVMVLAAVVLLVTKKRMAV